MPDDKHLSWLVKSRADNQALSLKLLKLLREHERRLGDVDVLGYDGAVVGQMLVSIAFSLWRAAFLADRDPNSGCTHAIEFLEKLILDNTINYTQDRNARDWTWAFYMSNAIHHLDELEKVLEDFKVEYDGFGDSYERWTKLQAQFSNAVDKFEKDLTVAKSASEKK
ncbi:MAG TPA: hypothetical protein VLW75_08005 [Rhizomicrobium sp.]|nr:hypothetical protein [Rhizomicrobium sp.]